MIEGLAESIGSMISAMGPPSGNYWRRAQESAFEAYEVAWERRQETDGADIALLVHQLKIFNVPGAYTGPEHRADLAFWFDAWHAGEAPSDVLMARRTAMKTPSRFQAARRLLRFPSRRI